MSGTGSGLGLVVLPCISISHVFESFNVILLLAAQSLMRLSSLIVASVLSLLTGMLMLMLTGMLMVMSWLSVIHHMTNRHEWPGNRHFHKCEHNRLSTDQQQRKKWLEPVSASHTALVNIVKDIVHLTEFVLTTALETYHSSKADTLHS